MPRLAEQLGFAPNERIAIVHADDVGMCHAANTGAFEALRRGPATCGSVMVPCPWFQEAARLARESPDLDLGVHLTLNAEWPDYRWGPVAGRSAVPSLVDAEGRLPRTMLEVLQNARPEEVEVELRAQVQSALDAGIDVTHLDSHMGTVLLPPFAPIYRKLGEEFGVPLFAARPDDAVLARAGLAGAGPVLAALAEGLAAAGFPVLDGADIDSLDFAPGEGEVHNARRIAGLRPGVSWLICHPATDGEELRSIAPHHAHQRDFERTFYGGEAGERALARAGVRTLGTRALREWMRGRGA
jgi:predicted glycoside hydrolase/deacetylase ChbG (UPF0249 family)